MAQWRDGRARAIATVTAAVRCAVYARVSTDAQADKEFSSVEAQQQACETYVSLHREEGWITAPEPYLDPGFTGSNTNRPGLQRLLADIEAGEIDVVVVYKYDRLSRSMLDFLQLLDSFKRHGVSFVSVSQRFDTSTPVGQMTLNILLSFAEFERQLISERTRDKVAAARRKGRFTGGCPVLGFDLDPKGGRLLVNESEAELVREIFRLFLEKQSLLQVVADLNGRRWTLKQWRTKAGKLYGGGQFNKCTLRRLLTNYLYIGKVNFEGKVYEGEHQAVVAPETFRQVQQILEENRRDGGAAHRNRHGALLRGILRCAACNAPMTFAPTKKGGRVYRYYRCSASMKHGRSACATGSLPADKIEALVVDQIRRVGTDPALQAETFRQVLAEVAANRRGLKAEAKRLAKQITATEKTVAKLVHTLADAKGDARSAVNAELEKAQEQLRSLEARSAEVGATEAYLAAQDIDEADVARALEEFDAIWEVLLTPERERVLQLLIERVSYNRETEELRIDLSPTGIATLQKELDGEETQ